jgi:hypothetical protein
MPLPAEVEELVSRFRQAAFRGGTYNEAEVRVDFIDPLFRALGGT